MCGIAGIATWRVANVPGQETIERMCDAMTHRGPDDAGYLVERGLALGMRRLSIIDLSGGISRSSTKNEPPPYSSMARSTTTVSFAPTSKPGGIVSRRTRTPSASCICTRRWVPIFPRF